MHFLSPQLLVALATVILPTSACIHFNATIKDFLLTINNWDDGNNDQQLQIGDPEGDIICAGENLSPTQEGQWSVECSKQGAVFDVFLDETNRSSLFVFYSYINLEAACLQQGKEHPSRFFFPLRIGSEDGVVFQKDIYCD